MSNYRQFREGHAGAGSIIVRIYEEGGEPRAFLRTVDTEKDEGADATYPSEQMTPETALRLAANKRQSSPDAEVLVELAADVSWRPEWGRLDD